MSFFDDDDFDEPTHVAHEAAPRRASSRRPGLGGGLTPDPQQARVRQMVALGVIVLVLILLTLAINGCVKSGRTNALKDYSRDVTALLQESKSEVAGPLFETLGSGQDATEMVPKLNSLRETAENEADRAKNFSPPGDDRGKAAQHDLELAMNLRASAIRTIAERLPAALGDADTSASAVDAIAGQMQALLASDVIIISRTKPLIDEALKDAGVSGAEVDGGAVRIVADAAWLTPDTVASKLGATGGGGGGSSTSGTVRNRSDETPTTAGRHGNGITGVTAGGTALTAGETATVSGNQINVQVANQGEADETNVDVGATFTPAGGKAVSFKTTVKTITKGASVDVPLKLPATVKGSGELKVQVGGVPGEENLSNNEQTFTVTFGG
ncbi:hypothetical protein [Patulibacter defluvii]|uniref:hypothetical protein n=1 Tax=Patulibacter defluvii TaxID=3095358 RepID=UPI002A76211C|nr:hypothetical protein [Patulibacter sp. DM4]